ncbi:MAG: hypothetical protein A2X28_10015 [Elusimicrobia bacterium GWA2_56_46]|nr:MAG: hypothetical protein A2X28_10015 [Elusimicrobia bacterium GWA2_56_46]OGR56299.1 MAG: hypothetical protein A2X39_01835 [Elusimicrobia bacterium GWC2_56_31]
MENISIKIILARPRNPDNIGAAARAMANFGLGELILVAPHIPTWRETAETAATAGSGEPVWLMERARAAVGAADVIKSARICATLAEAAADCGLLLGTSALQRRTPDRDVVLLRDLQGYLSERLPNGRGEGGGAGIGVLFGSERTGLSNEDLSHCHVVLNIPTRENQPSINLGQAVALVCYELAGRSSGALPRAVRPKAPVPTMGELDRVVSEICAVLAGAEGLDKGGKNYTAEIRRALLDARLTKGAMGVLKTLLRRLR